jgi:hypothetical protein
MVYRRNLKGLLHPEEMIEAVIGHRGGKFRYPDIFFS